MNPETQLVALAEAHGFKWYRAKGQPELLLFLHPVLSGPIPYIGHFEETTRKEGEAFRTSPSDLPKYLTDLQAMHELIMTRIVFGPPLHQYQSNEAAFQLALDEISMREQVPVWHFDASLYAEALLKTLKTWRDK